MTEIPQLHALTEGRWQARCQFCKTESIPVPAVDGAHAWADLAALGWSAYQPVPGAIITPLCKGCSAKNERIMAEVAKAKKARRLR